MATPTAPPRDGVLQHGRRSPQERLAFVHQRGAIGAAVASLYVLVAVVVWWDVWTGDPTSQLTCACGDPALFVWSTGWMAHAVAHGHSPFLSTAIFHPDGMNLLANTSMPLEAFLAAPVTWIFGPVAALNVINTAVPALTAMSTYWAVRRILRVGRLGALVGGLVVELSPSVVSAAAVSHIQVGMLAFLPVIAVCLHELLVRQHDPPWRWGALLALACAGQFFTGTELLVIIALLAVPFVAIAGVRLGIAAASGSASAVGRARHAGGGLAMGAAGTIILLAAPAWYALAGPRSFSGPPWPEDQGLSGVALAGTVSTHVGHLADPLIHLGGYLGPVGAPQNYLGVAAIAAAVAAVFLHWRRPVVWVLASLAIGAEWLSLGAVWHPAGTTRPWWVPFLPWDLLQHLPVVGGALPQNFSVMTLLAVAALTGLLVDRLWRAGRGCLHVASIGLALAVSGVVIAPLTTAWTLPLTVTSIDMPAWFVHDAPRLPAHSVVLAYPYAGPPGESEAMVWQAVDGMHFALAGGCCLVPGPNGTVDHGLTLGSATAILGMLTSPLNGPRPALNDDRAMATVRAALARWGVTTIVVTNHGMNRGADPQYATRWFTALLHRPPTVQDGSRVWTL